MDDKGKINAAAAPQPLTAAGGQRRIALLVAYDGTRYAGWQRQANAPSVQGELEKALSRLTKAAVTLVGCSRTDAGVHASAHVSHFETSARIPAERLPLALGTVLPPDIACLAAQDVPARFHARFSARGKQYAYYIWNAPRPSPMLRRYSAFEARPLDLEAMRETAAVLTGEHDFRAFQAAGSPSASTWRRLYSIEVSQLRQPGFVSPGPLCEPLREGLRWAPLRRASLSDSWLFPYFAQPFVQSRDKPGLGLIRIVVHGSGFLYNMMRILAGTLMYAGLHKTDPAAVKKALADGERCAMGKTLPACGLCLERVDYAERLFY